MGRCELLLPLQVITKKKKEKGKKGRRGRQSERERLFKAPRNTVYIYKSRTAII